MVKVIKNLFNSFLNVVFTSKQGSIKSVHLDNRIQLVWISEIVGRRIFLRLFEREETAFFKENVKEGDVCLDVGCNVGYFTNLFASQVGKSGKVFSIDAIYKNTELVKLNSTLNSTEDIIKVFWNAVGEEDGKRVQLNETDDTGLVYINGLNNSKENYSGLVKSVTKTEVLTSRIDTILESEDIMKLDILKMDIEGYEYFALKGMGDYLEGIRGPRIMMIELADSLLSMHDKSVVDVIDYLSQYSYEPFVLVKGELTTYSPKHDKSNIFFLKEK